eukprot:4785579-Pleurochrysis_carterae.AAC.1
MPDRCSSYTLLAERTAWSSAVAHSARMPSWCASWPLHKQTSFSSHGATAAEGARPRRKASSLPMLICTYAKCYLWGSCSMKPHGVMQHASTPVSFALHASYACGADSRVRALSRVAGARGAARPADDAAL